MYIYIYNNLLHPGFMSIKVVYLKPLNESPPPGLHPDNQIAQAIRRLGVNCYHGVTTINGRGLLLFKPLPNLQMLLIERYDKNFFIDCM